MPPSYTKTKRYLSRTRGSTMSGSQISSPVKMVKMINQAREGLK